MTKPFVIRGPLPKPLTVRQTAKKYGLSKRALREVLAQVKKHIDGSHNW